MAGTSSGSAALTLTSPVAGGLPSDPPASRFVLPSSLPVKVTRDLRVLFPSLYGVTGTKKRPRSTGRRSPSGPLSGLVSCGSIRVE